MSTRDEIEPAALPPPPLTRDELVKLVAHAHRDASYAESSLAGRSLAGQSKLPKLVAENLGAGLGQWNFFPEAEEIVDFALAYAPPSNEEEVWTLARAWASVDASAGRSVLALVGREILLHELRRIEVPALRQLFEEADPARARELRGRLGLDVSASAPASTPSKRAKRAAAPKRAAAEVREIPTRMPKPAFRPPAKVAPPPPPKQFHHPKFGVGVLESQEGDGPGAKLTIKFEIGSKTLLAQYVTEVPPTA
jgi:hypothetical protein